MEPKQRQSGRATMGDDIRRIGAMGRLSMAVAYGGVVHLSGQVAVDSGGGPVAEQAREVLGRIDALLAEAGTDRTRLLTADLFLADLAHLPEINAAWDAWLAGAPPPCRTTIETRLASPRYALEIRVSAALPTRQA
jgi:enamine deaminase RidA (YjgF/YER057c/UK114 family)